MTGPFKHVGRVLVDYNPWLPRELTPLNEPIGLGLGRRRGVPSIMSEF